MERKTKTRHSGSELLKFATGVLPILTVIVGALWGLYQYIQHRIDTEAKESRARLIEVRRPFLEKQLTLYFETASVVGRLVSKDPTSQQWQSDEERFWALYWVELAWSRGILFSRKPWCVLEGA